MRIVCYSQQSLPSLSFQLGSGFLTFEEIRSSMDMMGKLQEMQKKVEETKKRLDTVYVTGESPDGNIKVTVSANRQLKEVKISDELDTSDKEELEDLIVVAMNRALEEAEKVHEAEMAGTAKGMLPGM